ncbi:hypothetical protein IC620_09020 [Hazenella sp. IB182357]|uniref:Uncharacterized protein n=1 Tax=Polycladospora coralii TaxID=2771432 RepID=A0A926RUF4_9BACL|nr:hypothetical protein [Polycladospora coralii]MBD1372497.1 hypothetical protein [Polycladospora coralii]MBS7531374.1 hypothetical protein [Polycladospora coralii]
MANKQRGFVDIQLDKQRRLKFTMNALSELEDVMGKPVTELGNVGMKELRALLWAGLIHQNPDLTLQEAGDLMDLENIEYIGEKVAEAMNLAFPKEEGKKGKKRVSGPTGVGKKPNASLSVR